MMFVLIAGEGVTDHPRPPASEGVSLSSRSFLRHTAPRRVGWKNKQKTNLVSYASICFSAFGP